MRTAAVIAVLVLGACGAGGAAAQIMPRGGEDDVVIGTAGADVLRGGLGFDRLVGRQGFDRLIGGRGHDYAAAIRSDHVSMGSGLDVMLVARPRPDIVIDCGTGRDTVSFDEPPPPGLVVEGCEEVVVLR